MHSKSDALFLWFSLYFLTALRQWRPNQGFDLLAFLDITASVLKAVFAMLMNNDYLEHDAARCILWSGVLERSFGVEYWSGVESNFGVAKMTGLV